MDTIFKGDSRPKERLLIAVLKKTGVDLTGFATDFVEKRILADMTGHAMSDFDEYVAFLESNANACQALLNTFGIQVSRFFRNPEVFAIIRSAMLPKWCAAARDKGRELTAWSAGCASGEEAYSIGILLAEALSKSGGLGVVFGTDINSTALAEAESGFYERGKLLETPLGLLDKYFIKTGGGYAVSPAIKDMVNFSRASLSSSDCHPADNVFKTYDMVLCRNVLIYYHGRGKERALQNVTSAVASGGCLVLGRAESLPAPYCGQFVQPYDNVPIYRKN